MDEIELRNLTQKGESSRVQFMEVITNINQLSQEFCAMANSEGGFVIIGVSDSGVIKGLLAEQIHKLNQWISNVASQLIKPPISPLPEIVTIDSKNVLVVKLSAGYSKPYYTNEGIAYIKMGADKRIVPPEEILRLFQSAGKIYADEGLIIGSSLDDIDEKSLKTIIINKFRTKFGEAK